MRLLAALFIMILSVSFYAAGPGESFVQGSKGEYLYTVESGLQKVFQEVREFNGRARNLVELSLAKNEYEPFQVVVYAEKKSLTSVKIIIDGIDEKSFSVKINPVGYVRTIKPYYSPNYVPASLQGEFWPDPLLEEETINIKKGEVRPFWITIYASKDAKAGNYEGKIKITPADSEQTELPLKIKVYSFTLPAKSNLKTAFWLYGRNIMQYHNIKTKDEPRYGEMLKKYYTDMLEHRMSPFEIGINRPCPLPKLIKKGVTFKDDHYDFTGWDKWMQDWLDKGLNYFSLPITLEDKEGDIVSKSFAFGKHLKEKNWSDLACVFLTDETYKGEEERGLVHKGDPDLKNALTNPPDPKYPNVDIWIPQMGRGYYDFPEQIEWAKKAGKELWMYTSSPDDGKFYPCMNIDMEASEPRITPWLCFKHDLKGYLYWCVNQWANDPWQSAETFKNQNGNGSFYYPGKDGPIHSIRLENFRDGMEDYEYFLLLKTGIAEAKKKGADSQILAKAQKLLLWEDNDEAFVLKYVKVSGGIYKLRNDIAESIERLQEK